MFRRRRSEDFRAEIEAHIEEEVARLEEQGLSRDDARDAARRAFGNRTRAAERFHESGRWQWLENIAKDLRLAMRQLRRTPGWTAMAALTVALGIGSSVAIFSIVYTVLLRPLPLPHPERLLWIAESLGQPANEMAVAGDYFELRDLAAQDPTRGVASVGAYQQTSVSWTGTERTRQLEAGLATATLFATLEARPLYGRTFLVEEDRPNARHVAILSYGFWQREFAGDPNAVGRSMRIDRQAYQIVGIMPRDFDIPRSVDLWLPFAIDEAGQRARGQALLGVFMMGRAAPDAPLEQVNAQLANFIGRLQAAYPAIYRGKGFVENMKLYAEPLQSRMTRDSRPALLLFAAAVGWMLLIVCFNMANLMLARATARQREIAVRAALGAPRRRIAAQLMTESLLLSILGGLAGLAIAWTALNLLSSSRQFEAARLPQVSMDAASAWFALGLTVVCGLIFGMAPALGSSAFSVRDALQREGPNATGNVRLRRVRQALVVAELGLSLTLLIGAGLLAKTFWGLRTTAPGFEPRGLLTARVGMGSQTVDQAQNQMDFYNRVAAEVSRLPGVASASLANSIPPGTGSSTARFTIEGRPKPARGQEPITAWVISNDAFLPTLGVPLLAGRLLDARDQAKAPATTLINDTFRRRYFAGQNPLGQRIVVGNGAALEVVGVVGDVRHFGFERSAGPILYTSLRQVTQTMLMTMALVIRATGDPESLVRGVADAAATVDPDQPIFDVRTMEDRLSDSLGSRRFNAALTGTFALMAMFLAAVGVYGVMSYLVGLRLHEMGIRLALGARPGQIVSLVLKEGIALGILGAVLGVAGALGVSRYLSSLLFGVDARDPEVFAALTALILFVALAACYLPGRRASRIDPLIALRHE